MSNPSADPSGGDATWTDDDPLSGPSQHPPGAGTGPVIGVREELEAKKLQHKASMHRLSVLGVGLLILIMFLVLIVAVSFGGIDQALVHDMAQLLLLPMITALVGLIIGRSSRGKDDE